MILMANGNVSFISRYAVEIMKNDRVVLGSNGASVFWDL